ncbi:MAG: hypothetical protein HeimC3_53760 [Candidatus Heimdallarchaeota archaeon LC_3]|nr:MAG: hypothetical protein HeimC3_53760 [Candidatus Heimdallarchaeota archaeon LC_3]
MNLEIEILKFIEFSGEINQDSFKTLFLWSTSEENQDVIQESIENKHFDHTITGLFERNLIKELDGNLILNKYIFEKYYMWEHYLEKNKENQYSFELFWTGTIVSKVDPDKIKLLSDKFDESVQNLFFISHYSSVIVNENKKLKIDLRIFGIVSSLVINMNDFLITSRATTKDIPKEKHDINPDSNILELPEDPEVLTRFVSPNASVNYQLFQFLQDFVKQIDAESYCELTTNTLRPISGEDLERE